MAFVGVITNRKCFEKIRNSIKEEIKNEQVKLIHINLKSIENIKNIKFETIIIEDKFEKFKNKKEILKRICTNAKYLIINTDLNPETDEINCPKNTITYGLNQKATVTISSISDTDILIYWQKNIKNKKNKIIEIEEKRVKRRQKTTLKIYEILIIYTLFKLYNKSIITGI